MVDESGFILVSNSDGLYRIGINEIIYCKSDNNYTYIFSARYGKICISKPLKYFHEKLKDKGFERIHDSFIVARVYIQRLFKEEGSHYITLEGGTKIPVSRTKVKMVVDMMKKAAINAEDF